MPPTGKLKPEQIEVLAEWVRMGAPWPDELAPAPGVSVAKQEALKHWAWQPLSRKVTPPSPKDAALGGGDDRSLHPGQAEAKGLRPVGDADKRTLLRRVTST